MVHNRFTENNDLVYSSQKKDTTQEKESAENKNISLVKEVESTLDDSSKGSQLVHNRFTENNDLVYSSQKKDTTQEKESAENKNTSLVKEGESTLDDSSKGSQLVHNRFTENNDLVYSSQKKDTTQEKESAENKNTSLVKEGESTLDDSSQRFTIGSQSVHGK